MFGEEEAVGRRNVGFGTMQPLVPVAMLAGQLDALLKQFPKAKLHQFDSVSRDNVRAGSLMAFGEIVEATRREFADLR